MLSNFSSFLIFLTGEHAKFKFEILIHKLYVVMRKGSKSTDLRRIGLTTSDVVKFILVSYSFDGRSSDVQILNFDM